MTPHQTGTVLGCFVLLTAGVACNALFMQSRPTMASRATLERPLPRSTAERMRNTSDLVPPATRVAARRPTETGSAQRTARLDPSSATLDDLLRPTDNAHEDTETVRAVQRELRQRGYGPLVSDGIMRPVTRAAIMAYEHDHGLPLTGEATDVQLKRILLGGTAGADPAPGTGTGTGTGTAPGTAIVPKAATARAGEVVRMVQELLAKAGYQPGQIDGRLGEDTLRALREFETAKGLTAKGRISADVLIRLTEAAQAGQPASKSASAR
jgi:peptidoglycan hydrolase-like protein with peptidoglycan-binding domain